MGMLSAAALEALVTPALEALGYVLWGCVFETQGPLAIRVFMDKEGGVSIEDCAKAMHQIKGILAVEANYLSEYALEVSSPGIDRQLFRLAHYEQVCAQKAVIAVRLKLPLNGQRNFQGTVENVTGEAITLGVKNERITVDFNAIERAKVVPNWELRG